MEKILSFVIAIFLLAPPVFSHPPTNLTLTYDPATQILHIEMTHVTGNIREHHIRRLVISKNDEPPVSITVVRQTTPNNEVDEIPFSAKPKDTIRVEAFCKEGGSETATLVIPEPFNPDSY